MPSVAAVSGASGKIEVPMKPGRGYVKLVAKAVDGAKAAMTSTAYRVEVRPRVPVALLEPENKKVIKPGEDKGDVVFRWANAGQLIDLKLEVGETADLAKPLYLHNVEGKSAHALVIENASGEFFWRVSGRLPGTEETIVSEARSFNLLPKTPPPLEPPKITGPDDSRSITLAEMRTNGLSFVWEQAKGADEYEILVTGEGDLKKSETSALLGGKIQGLKPGSYKWQVVSKNAAGQVSPPSVPRSFIVESMPALAWTDKYAGGGTLIYKTAKPEVEIAWEKGPEQAVKWKLRLTGERRPASEKDTWKELDANRFQAKLDEPGAYQFEVVALDVAGEIVARSAQRSLAFEQAPPPGPPMLASAEKEIQARDDGSLDVAWNKVEDAKEYELQLKASDGKVVKSERTSGTKSSFKKLKPGPYTIGLRSIDSLGRTGPESEPRSVRVPEYSEVRAPKIKKLNVK
jgi:hypothetical protein